MGNHTRLINERNISPRPTHAAPCDRVGHPVVLSCVLGPTVHHTTLWSARRFDVDVAVRVRDSKQEVVVNHLGGRQYMCVCKIWHRTHGCIFEGSFEGDSCPWFKSHTFSCFPGFGSDSNGFDTDSLVLTTRASASRELVRGGGGVPECFGLLVLFIVSGLKRQAGFRSRAKDGKESEPPTRVYLIHEQMGNGKLPPRTCKPPTPIRGVQEMTCSSPAPPGRRCCCDPAEEGATQSLGCFVS